MPKDYDAIVIGAGIIGCCTAFELAKKGWRTLNVDRHPGAGYGSTSSSCAIIRFHYSTPDGVAMAREGYYHWIDWPKHLGVVDEAGMAKYVNTGCLVTKCERNHQLVHIMKCLDEIGVVYQELVPEEVERRFPFVDTRRYGPPVTLDDPRFGEPTGGIVSGAVYIPESGFISDPQLATHNVQRACEARGGEFLFNATITEILKADGRAAGVKLADGRELHAPVVVNVAGPASYKVNRMAGVEEEMKMKARPLKQEVCHVPAPEDIDYNVLGPIVSDGDIGCYSRPEVGNHLLIGSEEPECDPLHWMDDADDYDQAFTDQWQTQVMREAQRIQGLPIPNERQGVVDLYDCTEDWIPIYDKSALPGFYMAVGTSGNQFKNAPVAGALMAELIEKVEAGHDHDAEPVRFRMRYTGRTCNVGFFSRLRTINPDSSFSVLG